MSPAKSAWQDVVFCLLFCFQRGAAGALQRARGTIFVKFSFFLFFREVPRELCKERVILHVLHWFSKTKEAREDDHAGLPPCGVDRFCFYSVG